jgi:hypothetical protein
VEPDESLEKGENVELDESVEPDESVEKGESVEPDESLEKGESVEKSESVILKGNDIVDTYVMKTAEESGNAKLSSMIIKIKLESFLLLIMHVRIMALFFIVTDVIFKEKIIILPIIDVFGQ